jgi:hypothetical protein
VTSTASDRPPLELLLTLLRSGRDGLAALLDLLEEAGLADTPGTARLREALARPSHRRRGAARLGEALAVQIGWLPFGEASHHMQAVLFADQLEAVPLDQLPALNVDPDLPPATLARLVRAVFKELGLVGAHVRVATRRRTGVGAGVVMVSLPVALTGDHADVVKVTDAILARLLPAHRDRVVLL